MPCGRNRRLDIEKESQSKEARDRRRNNFNFRAEEPKSYE